MQTEQTEAPRTRIGPILGIAVVAVFVGMWVWLFAFADPNVPDELDDESFGPQAQEICEAARQEIDDLPLAQDAESPQARGRAVAHANDVLEQMVADIRPLAPTNEHDTPLVEAWLADWDTYLQDRVDYADQLLAGDEDAELLVTARAEGGGQITVTLDHFAEINEMPDCASPLDA